MTAFSDPGIWQQGTFTFTVMSDPATIDSRGNLASEGGEITIIFKMKPPPKSANLSQQENIDTSNPEYSCRVVAVNGDYSNPVLPSSIQYGDIGEGELKGRLCRATIKSVAQSSTSPITEKVLGSTVTMGINYRVRRGSKA